MAASMVVLQSERSPTSEVQSLGTTQRGIQLRSERRVTFGQCTHARIAIVLRKRIEQAGREFRIDCKLSRGWIVDRQRERVCARGEVACQSANAVLHRSAAPASRSGAERGVP